MTPVLLSTLSTPFWKFASKPTHYDVGRSHNCKLSFDSDLRIEIIQHFDVLNTDNGYLTCTILNEV